MDSILYRVVCLLYLVVAPFIIGRDVFLKLEETNFGLGMSVVNLCICMFCGLFASKELLYMLFDYIFGEEEDE